MILRAPRRSLSTVVTSEPKKADPTRDRALAPAERVRVPRASGAADYERAAVARRHALCVELAGRALPHLAGEPVASAEARGNVENLVGFAQVPVGLAGPLVLDTTDGPCTAYVPMATTEGALVASTARGMGLFAAAADAGRMGRARVVREGLSQHPMLVFDDLAGALAAAEVARSMRADFERLTASVTRHGRLVSVDADVLGRRLVLRLVFTTGDAIGVNMAAHAAELCSRALAECAGARERYVHGEDVEKRANARASFEGRGRSVVCEVVVPRAELVRRTRATPAQMVAIGRSYVAGFARLGTQNWLVQSANGLAAVMIACGQDAAYVTESATGFLELEETDEGDLYAAAHLPSLLVGTVGGGTGQGTAAECLALLGCAGDGRANRFAEILAATVLAGDLSLLASFCTHEFVAAHEALGRNRPQEPRP